MSVIPSEGLALAAIVSGPPSPPSEGCDAKGFKMDASAAEYIAVK